MYLHTWKKYCFNPQYDLVRIWNKDEQKSLENIIKQDPVLQRGRRWAFQSREERADTGVWKHLYVDKLQADLGVTDVKERAYLRE